MMNDPTEIQLVPANLLTGIAEMDEEHGHLIAIYNLVVEAETIPGDPYIIQTAVLLLKDYASQHLAHEEAVLAANGYVETSEHIARHDSLRIQLQAILEKVKDGSVSVSEFRQFIWEWLINHIGKCDMSYGEFFKGKSVTIPPMNFEALMGDYEEDVPLF